MVMLLLFWQFCTVFSLHKTHYTLIAYSHGFFISFFFFNSENFSIQNEYVPQLVPQAFVKAARRLNFLHYLFRNKADGSPWMTKIWVWCVAPNQVCVKQEQVLSTVVVSQVTVFSVHYNLQQFSHGNKIQIDINVEWVIASYIHIEQSRVELKLFNLCDHHILAC